MRGNNFPRSTRRTQVSRQGQRQVRVDFRRADDAERTSRIQRLGHRG